MIADCIAPGCPGEILGIDWPTHGEIVTCPACGARWRAWLDEYPVEVDGVTEWHTGVLLAPTDAENPW